MQCRLVGGIFFYLPKYLFRKVYKHIISRVFILLKVCGREDGSIILVPATQTIMLHMLSGRHQKFPNWPQHQILLGMNLDLCGYGSGQTKFQSLQSILPILEE